MKVRQDGWLSGVLCIPSPNFDRRPRAMPVELLVVHNISLPPGEFGGHDVVRLFTNRLDATAHPFYEQLRNLRVSAHFFIRRNGEIIQFVSCQHRAWHAGLSTWRGRERCNDFSIGVELEGSDAVAFAARQYISLAKLTRRLRRVYPLREIVGHSEVAPGRKTDPGPCFDWAYYRSLLAGPDFVGASAARGGAKI